MELTLILSNVMYTYIELNNLFKKKTKKFKLSAILNSSQSLLAALEDRSKLKIQ